jgi:hypothetical protein
VVEALDDAIATMHLTFGVNSMVTTTGQLLSSRMHDCYGQRLLLGYRQPAADDDNWLARYEAFDVRYETLGEIQAEFTEAARSALFLPPRHRYATCLPWNRRSEPGS